DGDHRRSGSQTRRPPACRHRRGPPPGGGVARLSGIRMSHLVRRAAEADYTPPSGWAAAATRYRRWQIVGEADGAVHPGFFIGDLDAGASIPRHVHSFERSFYVLSGTGVLDTPDAAAAVGPGDYGLAPVGVPHAWRNLSDEPVRWAEMQGPQPRSRYG